MMRKRFAKAALASVLAVSMAATATNWVAPNAFVEVAHAEETVTMNIQFKDGDEVVAGGDYSVPAGVQNYSVLQQYVPDGYQMMVSGDFMAEEGGKLVINVQKMATMNIQFKDGDEVIAGGDYTIPAGVQNYSVLEQYVPAGYEMTDSGDFYASDGEKLEVSIEKIITDVTMNIQFKDGDEVVAGGDYTVPAGVQNYSVLEQYVPAGYKMTVSGDFTAVAGGRLEVSIEKIITDVTMNIQFKAGDEVIAGGDYFVPAGVQNYSILQQYVPDGYQMTVSGDFMAEEGGKLVITIEKIVTSTTLHFVFVDEEGNNLGGGDYVVDQDGDGIFNWSEVQLPEGYKLIVSGDAFVKDYASGTNEVVVEKIAKASIINVTFVDAAGNVLGGGDFFVDADGDGIFNLSEIEAPAGYKTTLTGDQFVSDYVDGKTVIVEKINKGTIINVVYKDAQGRNLGGGDYIVDLDGDGIANYSELPLPEGYQLTETGDFFVNEGTSYTVTLKRAGAAIIHVQFVSDGGKVLGGGDYFVDADGDGIANYSELTLPEGYELIETGDFFVDTDQDYVITVSKIIEGTIINVVYVDKEGNVLGGGDYFVDADDDGIANYSELTLPEGYELIVTGDFFVNPNHSYTIELQKIQKGTMINVVFEDEEGNHLGGGDYIVDEDGDGIANYSELDLPVGYELIVTGDFFVEEGESYTIVLKMRETVLTVTFEDTEGNVVDTVTLKAGQPGSPEETYAFVLGEHFNLPEGYQLAEGVDQVTTIEIPYGSVGGHTMIVEKMAEEPGETPEEPTDPEKPGETPDDPDVTVDPSEPTDTPETSEPAETDDTPKTGDTMMMPYYAAFGAGISLLAMLLLVRRRLVK